MLIGGVYLPIKSPTTRTATSQQPKLHVFQFFSKIQFWRPENSNFSKLKSANWRGVGVTSLKNNSTFSRCDWRNILPLAKRQVVVWEFGYVKEATNLPSTGSDGVEITSPSKSRMKKDRPNLAAMKFTERCKRMRCCTTLNLNSTGNW